MRINQMVSTFYENSFVLMLKFTTFPMILDYSWSSIDFISLINSISNFNKIPLFVFIGVIIIINIKYLSNGIGDKIRCRCAAYLKIINLIWSIL